MEGRMMTGVEPSEPGMRHPEHDRLVEVVRTWYSRSYPAMGYLREARRFGVYTRNPRVPGGMANGALLRGVAAGQVPALLADLRDYFGGGPVSLVVDDRRADALLGPALVAAGCSRGAAQAHLAHVGPAPESPAIPGLTIEPATEANLRDYAITKLEGFADGEAEPADEAVRNELAFRRAEMGGEGRFLLARLAGEPAAIVAWYEGEDRSIFLLATRVPFRGRGIARALLCHVLAEASARGCRAVIINADPDDTPIRLYRRLGFTDEVYRRRGYRLPAATA
jgi:ribosomal protein S18 acetylase RimI-like enzyme